MIETVHEDSHLDPEELRVERIKTKYPLLAYVSENLLRRVDDCGGIPLLVRAVGTVKRHLDPKRYKIGLQGLDKEDRVDVLVAVRGKWHEKHEAEWAAMEADWERSAARWATDTCSCVIRFMDTGMMEGRDE